jgi:hypothetical protein
LRHWSSPLQQISLEYVKSLLLLSALVSSFLFHLLTTLPCWNQQRRLVQITTRWLYDNYHKKSALRSLKSPKLVQVQELVNCLYR